MPATGLAALRFAKVVDDVFSGTQGNADLAILTLLVAGAAKKLDNVVSFKLTPEGTARACQFLEDCGHAVPKGFDPMLPALRIKKVCDFPTPDNMKAAVNVLSAVAVVGFTRAHALGTLAGVRDDAIARSGDLTARTGKSFDKAVERIANLFNLNITISKDRSALYKLVKMLDRTQLAYDGLATAEASPDSMRSPTGLPAAKYRALMGR